MPSLRTLFWSALALAALSLAPHLAQADGGITYVDIAEQPTRGLAFERFPSSTIDGQRAIWEQSLIAPVTPFDFIDGPMMPRGLPGVAILDYDVDGDLDIYVTNGHGAPNGLFSSQLVETGNLWFKDVAVAAGADLTEQDSFGTCFGDLDNDGDPDLLVLGRNEPNRLLENLGNGQFVDRPEAGLGGGDRTSPSCSIGDVDADGLLDVVVGNSFDQARSAAIITEPYALNEANFLYRNLGDGTFEDVSESSGITVNGGYPPGAAGITWATMVADVDLDGDADVVFMDDQGGIPPARVGGIDRAYIHVFLNDGTGQFVDSPIILDGNTASEWMGVDIGDLDCDGDLDIFAACFGDYGNSYLGIPFVPGTNSSRPFFGNGDGTFMDPGLDWGPDSAVFGWGVAIYDYDNDADLDVLYHGGLDAGPGILTDNPGALMQNQGCSGRFVYDSTAITRDHVRRNVRAVGIADLDHNGYVDVVTAANLTIPDFAPLVPAPVSYGSPFDATARLSALLAPVDGGFVWLGYDNENGDLAVELADGNGHPSVTIDVEGGVGRIDGAAVNRDGIGAVLTFTPDGGASTIQVVTGGASHSSQHALDRLFGFGEARRGTLEVLWPGGLRNRLYNVKPGRVVMPEIPCDVHADWRSPGEYIGCVRTSLIGYLGEGSLTGRQALQHLISALRFYRER